ncbi:glycosyltransferase [Guptibacillus sedimenti]|uniref:glycosyltransferase n=1 Tax=Guptibacillus sedimenti TaxID=3025680 RepID=UPI002362C098|nr:glycosyltransferase [Pseudalkalibacillus sedimenti]
MKKKVIFMLINMNIGGTEKAFLNMISKMSKEEYEISVFLLEKSGGFLKYIPDHVQIEILEEYKEIKKMYENSPYCNVISLFKEGKFINSFMLLKCYLSSKLLKDRRIYISYLLKDCSIKYGYDIAVAYAGPMDLISCYVLKKIKARKKIQWVHFDVTKISFNKKSESKMFKKFSEIFVVSEEGKTKLISMIPAIKNKVEVFPNLISSELISSQAKNGKGFNDEFEGIRILTVGRLSGEKGQDLAIKVLAELVKKDLNVRWYCLGEGNSRKRYEKLVEEYQMKNEFVFLGRDSNPYPYIEQCDIYVQPSRHEGFCITLAEAKYLNKPIVTTNFTGAKEQIVDGVTGLIVSTDNEKELLNGILRLIKNPDLRKNLSLNLRKEILDSAQENKIVKEFIP